MGEVCPKNKKAREINNLDILINKKSTRKLKIYFGNKDFSKN